MTALGTVLDGLLRRYRERVPDVGRIVAAMIAEGIVADAEAIENDHIAFRTLGVPHLGIASLEKIFLHYGYERRDRFGFAAKKLDAYWYSPPHPALPRIFISELRVSELSAIAQTIVRAYSGGVERDPVDAVDLDDGVAVDALLHQPLWCLPTYADYRRLLEESEYAAWTIYNRYYLNHFTISVHNLPEEYASLAAFDAFLERNGILLSDAGGTIKTSPDGLLLQSATVAQLVDAVFAQGDRHAIAGSYVEFAERRVLPAFAHLPAAELRREHRRDGFETGNADRIFESTYTSQTTRA
jgi:Domain of unknown function (DUF1338)